MANDATVTFRCSTEELTRADVLAPLLERDPNIRAFGNPGKSSKRKASR